MLLQKSFLIKLSKGQRQFGRGQTSSNPNIDFMQQTVKGNEKTTSLQGLCNDVNLDLVNHGQVYVN